MAIQAGTAYIDVKPNMRNFSSGLSSGIKKSLATAAKSAAILGAALTTAAVVGIKRSIGAASDLNEAVNKANVTFGQGRKEVQAWSKTTATALGISRRQALESAAGFAVFGDKAGLANDKLPEFSENLVTAASDLASFHNADPSEVLDALKSGLVGEVEPLRRFGILLSDAAVQQEGIKEGLQETTGHLTDQQKVLLRYKLIMEGLGPAAGDFERTSQGLANQQRILTARLEDVEANLGKFFIPIMSEAAEIASDFLGWVDKLVNTFGKKGFVFTVKLAFTDVKETITDWFDRLKTFLLGGRHPLKLKTGQIIEWETDKGFIKNLTEAFSKVPWDEVGESVWNGLSAAFKTAVKGANAILQAISDFIDKHKDAIAKIGGKLVLGLVSKLVDPLFWAENWQLALSIMLSAFPIGRGGKLFGEILVKLFGRGAKEAAPAVIRGVDNILAALGKGVVAGSKNIGKRIGESILDGLKAVWERIPFLLKVSIFYTLIDQIKRRFEDAFNWIKEHWQSVVGSLAISFTPFVSTVLYLKGLFEDILSIIESIIGKLPSIHVPGGGLLDKAGGFLKDHLAAGGPVMKGSTYLVGEDGPELFTASRNGRIIPNDQLAAHGGGYAIVNLDEAMVYITNVAAGEVSGAAAHRNQMKRMRR